MQQRFPILDKNDIGNKEKAIQLFKYAGDKLKSLREECKVIGKSDKDIIYLWAVDVFKAATGIKLSGEEQVKLSKRRYTDNPGIDEWIKKIRNTIVTPPSDALPSLIQWIIPGCLQVDPAMRPTIEFVEKLVADSFNDPLQIDFLKVKQAFDDHAKELAKAKVEAEQRAQEESIKQAEQKRAIAPTEENISKLQKAVEQLGEQNKLLMQQMQQMQQQMQLLMQQMQMQQQMQQVGKQAPEQVAGTSTQAQLAKMGVAAVGADTTVTIADEKKAPTAAAANAQANPGPTQPGIPQPGGLEQTPEQTPQDRQQPTSPKI